MGLPRRYDDFARLERDTAPLQMPYETLGRRLGERDLAASFRVVDKRSVLRNHIVEQLDARADHEQVVEPPARQQHGPSPGDPQPLDCLGGGLRNPPIDGERTVIVSREGKITHGSNPS